MTPETLALLMRTSYGLRFEGFSWDGPRRLSYDGGCGDVDCELCKADVEQQRKEVAVNMERNAERMQIRRDQVYGAIDSERDFQDYKWGTIEKHPHEVGGWLTLMRKLLSDAEAAWSTSNGDHNALDEIRKVIAVGVACAEQHGIVGRSKHQENTRMRT